MDLSLLVDAALRLLGTLVSRTGDRTADEVTTGAARTLARRLRERLPPDHWLAEVLGAAEHGRGPGPPEAAREELGRLLGEDPGLLAEVVRDLRPVVGKIDAPITIDHLQQYAKFANVGPATYHVSGPLAGPSPSPEAAASVVPTPDPEAGPANIVQIANFANVGPVEIIVTPRPRDPARQLEAVRGFVGRTAEAARLRRLLEYLPGTAPLAVVTGPPGVGKTDLALYVANKLAARDYRDLQLLVRLSDQTGRPADAAEVLRDLLLALGVSPGDIADGLVERQKQYRSALSGSRALVVLDGATRDGQVLPLLPPLGCAALVTTGRTLGGTVAKGTEVRLAPLSTREALALLAARLGRPRVARQPFGARRLVLACDRLPLAIGIVAALLAAPYGRRTRLRHASHLLRDQAGRAAPGRRALDAAFAISYRALPSEQRRTFQLLGLLNTATVETGAVAAAAGVDDDEAERRLAVLAGAHLLEESARPGSWRLRGLVLDYARGRADAELTGQAREDAARRAIQFHLSQVGRLQARLAAVAGIDPDEAARRQAELDEESARGAALVDRVVRYRMNLLGLVADELVGALLHAVTVWPDAAAARRAMQAILRAAALPDTAEGTDPVPDGTGPRVDRREVERRARDWLRSQPDPPPGDGGVRRAPTREEVRALFAPYLGAGSDLPPDDDERPRQRRPLLVEGKGFLPGEGIRISVDGADAGGATADLSGAFATTVWYVPGSTPPTVIVTGDLSGPYGPIPVS